MTAMREMHGARCFEAGLRMKKGAGMHFVQGHPSSGGYDLMSSGSSCLGMGIT